MKKTSRIIFCAFFGMVLSSLLAATIFSIGSILDGTRPSEALAYGVAVGVMAGFFGVFIGMVIGIFNLGLLGGALTGLLASAGAVAFYVLTFSRPNQYGYFLGQSVIIVLVLGLPAILTGLLTALVKNRFF
jgi:hypothetical protein